MRLREKLNGQREYIILVNRVRLNLHFTIECGMQITSKVRHLTNYKISRYRVITITLSVSQAKIIMAYFISFVHTQCIGISYVSHNIRINT